VSDDVKQIIKVEQRELYDGTAFSPSTQLAQQTEALCSLANSFNQIASFITGGGLGSLVSGYAKAQSVQSILGGLAAHDGRNGLDARVLGQNAIEIAEQIMQVFNKMADREAEQRVAPRDPEIHKATEPA